MNNDLSTGGLVLGLLGIVCGIIGFFVCWWLGIVGLVLGIVGICLGGKVSGGLAIGICTVELVVTAIVFTAVLR